MENCEPDGDAAKQNNADPTEAAQPRNEETANGSGDGACNQHGASNAAEEAVLVVNDACAAQSSPGTPSNAVPTHLTTPTRSANHHQRDRSKDRRNPARDHNRNRMHNAHVNRSGGGANGTPGYLCSVSQNNGNHSRNGVADKHDEQSDCVQVIDLSAEAPNAQATPPGAQSVGMQYNWQSSKPTLKERLLFMFNNEIMADVHFVVGRGSGTQRIPAHKFVLSIGSAVFDAMFNGGMATKSDDVELPDVEASAFLALLRFLYSDEVHIGPETVMTTLYTAKKYAVPALEKACVDFLKRNLSSDNAFMLLTQVFIHLLFAFR